MKRALLLVCLFLSGCTLRDDPLPVAPNTVDLKPLQDKVQSLEKTLKEREKAWLDEKNQLVDSASSASAYVGQAGDANESNPDGRPKTATRILIGEGVKRLPPGKAEEIIKAQDLKIQLLTGTNEEITKRLAISDADGNALRVKVQQTEAQSVAKVQELEGKLADTKQQLTDNRQSMDAQERKFEKEKKAYMDAAQLKADIAAKEQTNNQIRDICTTGQYICGVQILIFAALAWFTKSPLFTGLAGLAAFGLVASLALMIAVTNPYFQIIAIVVVSVFFVAGTGWLIWAVVHQRKAKVSADDQAYAKHAIDELIPALAKTISGADATVQEVIINQISHTVGNGTKAKLAEGLDKLGVTVPEILRPIAKK